MQYAATLLHRPVSADTPPEHPATAGSAPPGFIQCTKAVFICKIIDVFRHTVKPGIQLIYFGNVTDGWTE
ncbi:hypothetical protein DFZ58_24650 [Escherichia coli]|nr:hypothetical protein [Escherichia coli]EFN9733357.1 hypothetical protein [Escherichia coli]EFN9743126.1 hypothetical protein [Escherichia coli]EFO0661672.1 hypothetical protein [Escherichia coli]